MKDVKTNSTPSKKVVKTVIIVSVSVILALAIAIPLFTLGGIWGILDHARYVIYPEYYSIKTDICTNPGLSDGFVCQGIAAYEAKFGGDRFLVSGYMKDGEASRIYVTDLKDNSYFVKVILPDGEEFKGHAGGIAVSDGTVYLASNHSLFVISLEDILGASKGDTVKVQRVIPVNVASSFVFADEEYLFVGEFHDGKDYITDNYYKTPDGDENHAIVSIYTYESLNAYEDGGEDPLPVGIYSIRNKVQGFCVTDDERVVMSTSYGLADSFYYVYDMNGAECFEYTEDGVPVFYFAGECREIKGPAMAEGLDIYDGSVITLSECASDKYIFGKFFFANKIVALDF